MACRVEILRRDDRVELPRQRIDGRDDGVAALQIKDPAFAEVVLHIHDDERVGWSGVDGHGFTLPLP